MKDLEKLTGRQFDRQACATRNRLAAKRDGVDAMPVRLLAEEEYEEMVSADGETLAASYGKLPKSQDGAMELIHALGAAKPDGTPLGREDVYLVPFEALNTNFVEDRHLFIDRTTLRNVAGDYARGVAFMNSHRTGGMSHPSELPFGRTLAGRYEEMPDGSARTLGLMFMLAGVQPNGNAGPSTDDLFAMIQSKTLFDVSAGLYGGMQVCDLDGYELGVIADGEYLCPHAPGTTYQMTEPQQKAQKGRGVKSGGASYSLVDSHAGETSAVYDGAVPGAGFRKALALHRAGRLEEQFLSQARGAYATLLRRGELEESGGDLPTGQPLGEQLDAALTLLTDCITRGQEIATRRLSEQRLPVAAARREEWERLYTALGELLATGRPSPDPDRLLALRRRILAARIKAPSGAGV